MAYFGNGKDVEIGDFSGIGSNCHLPNNLVIGDYVMMGPDVYILSNNHCFDRTDIPMFSQGMKESEPTIIENDCWIGGRVIITPGKTIKHGSIIGAGSVVTKDVEEFSIMGGNPAKLIRKR